MDRTTKVFLVFGLGLFVILIGWAFYKDGRKSAIKEVGLEIKQLKEETEKLKKDTQEALEVIKKVNKEEAFIKRLQQEDIDKAQKRRQKEIEEQERLLELELQRSLELQRELDRIVPQRKLIDIYKDYLKAMDRLMELQDRYKPHKENET